MGLDGQRSGIKPTRNLDPWRRQKRKDCVNQNEARFHLYDNLLKYVTLFFTLIFSDKMLVMCLGQERFHIFKNISMAKYSISTKLKYYSIRMYGFFLTIFCTT